MRLTNRKIVDDALALMSSNPPAAAKNKYVPSGEDPRYASHKKAVRRLFKALAEARWLGPEDVQRLRPDLADTRSGRIIGFRVGHDMRMNVIIVRWADAERDGELEIQSYFRVNPANWPKRVESPKSNTAQKT